MPVNKFRADVLEVRDELRKAEAALDVRRYDLAKEILLQMLREHPENSAVFYTLARAHVYSKKHMEALQAIRESLRLDPNSSQSHTLYGGILSNLGRFKDAGEAYRVSLALVPTNAYAHYMYAALLVDKLRDTVRASVHARKALELDPAAALHHVVMAKILGLQKHFVEADLEFHRALSLDPENNIVRRVYSWYLLYQRNNPVEAVEHLKRALQLDPYDAGTRKNFLIALKAKQKLYKLNWLIAFSIRGRQGRAIFILAIWMFLLLKYGLDALWGTNQVYVVAQGIFLLLFLACCCYLVIIEVLFTLLNKRGHLK
ncbi:MAG: tetratricopeptide repeat protein, partial [Ktedonobacteraceae bacterium]